MNREEFLSQLSAATGISASALRDKSQDEILNALPQKEAAAIRQLLKNPKELEKWMNTPQMRQLLKQIGK